MYFTSYDIDAIRHKILLIADPNSGYTQEDFDKEFNTTVTADNVLKPFKLSFNFVNKSDNPDPEYSTAGSSGFDIRANLDSPITLHPHGIKIVPTGLYFEIPENFEIQIRSRSSLSVKHGVVVLNSPGTIDSDYRGEIGVILINHSENDFIINNGDRIAQAVISSVISKNNVNLIKVNEIDINTERGTGGYGSTGIN